MRRILIFIGLSVLIAFGGYAQKSQRSNAYFYLKEGKLDKAKESIDAAIQHEKTMQDVQTWIYRGQIYYEIARSPLPAYNELDPNAPRIAYESLQKAREYDEKGRKEGEINDLLSNLVQIFYNTGNTAYQAGDYATAMGEFEFAYKINEEVGRMDTIAAYYTGMCGVMAEEPETAEKYLQICIDAQFDDPNIYTFYNRASKQLGDTARAMEVLQAGRERYPEELSLLLEEAQTYLERGMKEELLASLLEAIEADPENANLYFLTGKTYDDMDDPVKAEEYYKKAAEIKPDFFEAYYNIGAIYNNKAAQLTQAANNLPLDQVEEYNKLIDEANKSLEEAMPYLEKALEINPEDELTIQALKEVYTRLKMNDKLESLN